MSKKIIKKTPPIPDPIHEIVVLIADIQDHVIVNPQFYDNDFLLLVIDPLSHLHKIFHFEECLIPADAATPINTLLSLCSYLIAQIQLHGKTTSLPEQLETIKCLSAICAEFDNLECKAVTFI